jgi:hypothetical protein
MSNLSGMSVMFSEMRPDASWLERFNRWYDEEHIPLRMRIPGFASAQRYRQTGAGNDNYLALYELESLAAFSTPEFKAVKAQASDTTNWMLANVKGFTRYLGDKIGDQIGDQIGDRIGIAGGSGDDALDMPVLHGVLLNVPPPLLLNYDEWHEREHVPSLLRSIHGIAVRRFAVTTGEPRAFNRLTLYHLSETALASEAAARAKCSPWHSDMAANSWLAEGQEATFTRIGSRQVSQL